MLIDTATDQERELYSRIVDNLLKNLSGDLRDLNKDTIQEAFDAM